MELWESAVNVRERELVDIIYCSVIIFRLTWNVAIFHVDSTARMIFRNLEDIDNKQLKLIFDRLYNLHF